uniref:Uncharacterized protein n=1 Tax=Hordeum vulgare subsp. vulgare TaxID=112509 RepID=M0UFC4_HORVV
MIDFIYGAQHAYHSPQCFVNRASSREVLRKILIKKWEKECWQSIEPKEKKEKEKRVSWQSREKKSAGNQNLRCSDILISGRSQIAHTFISLCNHQLIPTLHVASIYFPLCITISRDHLVHLRASSSV